MTFLRFGAARRLGRVGGALVRREVPVMPPDVTVRLRQGRGVDRITLSVDAGEPREAALTWLAGVLPVVQALDRAARGKG